MFKSIAKLLLASLLSVTLIIPNTLAFHKNVNFEKKKKQSHQVITEVKRNSKVITAQLKYKI